MWACEQGWREEEEEEGGRQRERGGMKTEKVAEELF